MARSRLLLLVPVLATYRLQAARIKGLDILSMSSVLPPEQDGAAPLSSYVGSQDMICGGPQIWSMLTASSSVTAVQNIKWSRIEALTQEYIGSQTSRADDLKIQIESLSELIAEKEVENKPQRTTAEQHRALIEAAVGADAFGGLDAARASGCGSPRGKRRVSRSSYQMSQEVCKAAAERFFKDGLYRLDSDGFLETCHEMLPAQEEWSYCDRLCQGFKDRVQQASHDAVGETSGGPDDLIKQRQQKLQDLQKAEAEVADCSRAWEGLSVFRSKIEALKGAMQERFEDLMGAERALDDAMWDLADMDDDLKEEETVLADAVKSLEEAGQQKAQASTALQGVIDREVSLRHGLKNLNYLLQESREEFESAKNADKTVVDLVTAVSATMVKMTLFSTSGVMEPLKSFGLESSLDVEEFFPEDPLDISSGGTLRSSVERMHDYCSVTAMPAFKAVKDFTTESGDAPLDLSPLCEFGEVEDITTDLNEAVVDRMDSVKEQILWVKSWLNPYRASKKMTPERSAELVDLGEPKGLQEVISVYHGTQFFQYLKNWRYKGPFLELIAQLQEYLESLDASVKQLLAEIKSLQAELEGLLAEREKTAEELESAKELLTLRGESKAKVEKAVAELHGQKADLEKELAELRAAVEEAQKKYEEAKMKLLEAHAEGTFVPPGGQDSLVQLQIQQKEAAQLISLIERSLSRRERAHAESKA